MRFMRMVPDELDGFLSVILIIFLLKMARDILVLAALRRARFR